MSKKSLLYKILVIFSYLIAAFGLFLFVVFILCSIDALKNTSFVKGALDIVSVSIYALLSFIFIFVGVLFRLILAMKSVDEETREEENKEEIKPQEEVKKENTINYESNIENHYEDLILTGDSFKDNNTLYVEEESEETSIDNDENKE